MLLMKMDEYTVIRMNDTGIGKQRIGEYFERERKDKE